MNHSKYAFLDGLRGLAAIFVVIHHTENYWHFIVWRAYLAVDLFFILSGFVIAHAYENKLKNGVITVPEFFLIRLIRLYPMFFLSLLLCSLLLIAKTVLIDHGSLEDFSEILHILVVTAFFLPSHMTGNPNLFPINSPYWSLFFELAVNMLYGLMVSFLDNFILKVIVLTSGIMIIGIACHQGNLNSGWHWGFESLVTGFTRSVFGIFLGVLIYRNSHFLERYLAISNPIIQKLTLLIVGIILASPSFGGFDWIIDVLSVIVIFPLCVFYASQGKSTRLENVLLLLGAASYPIYVLHKPIEKIATYLIHGTEGIFAPISGIILVGGLIALSLLVEKHYDIPMRRWISSVVFKKLAAPR